MNTLTIISVIVIYLWYQISDAFGDVSIELGYQAKWHSWGAVQAGLFILVLSYGVYGISWKALIMMISLVILRFPVFNILHNLKKGQNWYYLSDRGIDGIIKRLFYKKKSK